MLSMANIDPVYLWRRIHLHELVNSLASGNAAEFGRKYGYDRAQIAQFLSATYNKGQSIGEKAARTLETRVARDYAPMPRWMDTPISDGKGVFENAHVPRTGSTLPRLTWTEAGTWLDAVVPFDSTKIETWDTTGTVMPVNSF